MTMIQGALRMEDLFEYIDGTLPKPSDEKLIPRWNKANALVALVLNTTMAEDVNLQLSHFSSAAEIWSEARRLYSSQMITDYTLTVTNLVTTKYEEGDDIMAHLAKIKGWRRDLILMNRDIPDDLFACFMRISMPASWNYIFAGLPAQYTSAEVERRIKDEHGVRLNQESAAAYFTRGSLNKKKSNSPIPGQPFCTNCKRNGHSNKDCWSKGGGAEGKGPKQKKKQKKRDDEKDERKKGKN